MDRKKKERRIVRTAVTKLITAIESELQKEEINRVQVEASLPVLDEHLEKLREIDEAIQGAMLDDDQITEETLEVETSGAQLYRINVNELKIRANKLLYPSSTQHRERSPASEGGRSSCSNHKTLKYPKIELRKFGGDLKDWLGWWAQYEKIHEDEDLDESDKFTYLIQSMVKGSRAEELIKGYPQSRSNYKKAVEALKNRFGQPKLLKQVYVRELISMIMGKTQDKKTALSSLFDRLVSHLRSLESLGVTVEQMGVFLFPMVESCLPDEILVAWQRSPNFGTDGSKFNPPKSDLDFLMEFLRQEINNEEQRRLARSGFDSVEKKRNAERNRSTDEDDAPTAAGLFSGSTAKPTCLFCEKSHQSKDCFLAQKMTREERQDKVKKKGACFVCLKGGHLAKKCKANIKCPLCSKKHELMFCPQNPKNQTKDEQKKEAVATTKTNLNCTNEVVLRTLMVRLENPSNGKFKNVRVLLDCGSQRSYLLKKTAEDLKLVPSRAITMSHQLFGGSEVKNTPHSVFDLKIGSVSGSFSTDIQVMDQEQICGFLPRVSKGPWMNELKKFGIFVNDLDDKNSREIEFLIGADILGDLLTGNLKKLKNGLTVTETHLGWTLMGEMKVPGETNLAMTVICLSVASATVHDLWSLDVLGIRDPTDVTTQEERDAQAMKNFCETVVQKDEGRYSVALPWVPGGVPIPSNRNVAEQRLQSTTRKLIQLGKLEDYGRVFSSWEEEGIISRVNPEDGEGQKCHYLPHRAVIKEESKTTPIRPVFDASCKIGRSPSLNGCLEKGPNLIELIPSILLRFRFGRFGVVSDIRKAFQMIEVNPEDRDSLRFLWWEDVEKKKMIIYRHNRVVFGMNCSPFLLGAVLNFHLDKVQSDYPETVTQLKNSIYVDNCVLAVNTLEEFEKFKSEAVTVLKLAGMDLRQWERTGDTEELVTNVLGMKWNKVEDVLSVDSISEKFPGKITKRIILSYVHQIFDPLGFLCPIVLVPKLLVQRAWMENRSWDEPVSTELQTEFLDWWNELIPVFDNFRIPRKCTGGKREVHRNFQFHVFSDASKNAYAAVVFLRTEIDGTVEVQMLQAKSRIAPTKKMTIPRLELMGCAIAARLITSIKKALQMEDVVTYFWTDSSTALSWITNSDDWGTFVGNRVREILSLTRTEDWRFVPGLQNPADLPSRGISPKKFLELRWWEGPKWLKLQKEDWPSQEFTLDPELSNCERRKSTNLSLLSLTERPWYLIKNSHLSNVRILTYVLRFVHHLKKKKVSSDIRLDIEEMDQTEKLIFKLVQLENFNSQEEVICGLRVTRDEEGLIRVKTKVTNRKDTTDFKAPVLLPNNHPLVTLLIQDEHQFNSHAGAQFLMGRLREKVWIVRGRQAVKKVIHACVKCQRFTKKKREVSTPALPEVRVKDAGAFDTTGIDLAGPLVLKDKSKVWIVIFTCAVFRCVHLELVTSISTQEFLLAFTRFCMRKRRPTTVYTDNGTNLVGSNNTFKTIDWTEVEKKTKQYRIQWRFNPPSAPWWGGWWERLIRTLKDLLKRMFGFAKLNYQDLETCICEAEWVMNHRPLTFITEDQDDLTPLTPAMFIYDLPVTDIPEIKIMTGTTLGARREKLKTLLEELQVRFRKEYLGILVQRGSQKTSAVLGIGDLVFVGREDVKRVHWPMGRIVEMLPGKDGTSRVAKVKTKNGVLLRPLQRLYSLEVSQDDNWRPMLMNFGESEPAVITTSSEEKKVKLKRTEVELEPDAETKEVVTRSGRVTRKPVRFCDY